MRANDIRVVREAVKLENRKPPQKKHNGLGALCLPLNERPSYIESVGLEIKFFFFFRIVKHRAQKSQHGLYIPSGLANQLVLIDGVPGMSVHLKHRFETPKQALAILYEGFKARHLL